MTEKPDIGTIPGFTPPSERDLPSSSFVYAKEALMNDIAGQPAGPQAEARAPSPRRRVSRRSRVLVFVLAPAALLGGTLAYAHNANRSPAQIQDFVTCYQTTSLDGGSVGYPLNGRDPSAVCTDSWTSGALSSRVQGPAPLALTACVADWGGVDIFPTSDSGICTQLDLQPLPVNSSHVQSPSLSG